MIPEDAIWILELIRNRDARTEAEKDAVNAAIEALKAQLSQEGTTKDAISRQAAIDIERNATVDTNPSHFEAHQKFTQFMDDAEISSFGRWQWSNGFNTALTAVGIDLKKLPPARPEPTDINAKEAVYNLAEKIGIHQLFALTVELRGEPIQPEPTYEQVEEYCKKRRLHVVTADFFESTKPQRLGHWIKHIDPFDGEQYECSECGVLWEFNDGTPEDNEAHFCPKCGAKMTTSTK